MSSEKDKVRVSSGVVSLKTKAKFDSFLEKKGLKTGFMIEKLYELIAEDEEFRMIVLRKIYGFDNKE